LAFAALLLLLLLLLRLLLRRRLMLPRRRLPAAPRASRLVGSVSGISGAIAAYLMREAIRGY
jgi:hypothetical protein